MNANGVRKFLVDIKIYISRAQSYLSIANSGMILFIFLSKIKEAGIITWPLETMMLALFFLTIVMLVFLGWIEVKLDFFSEEQRRTRDRDPYFMDLMRRMEVLENKIDALSK